jgi:flavin reductase (DIM6/NTAB) family NADH-FMN oxidoreductase RutF
MGKVKTGAYNPLPVVPIVLMGANVNGKPNYMAVGFVSGVNIKPAIVYVSLNKKHHTPKGIIENSTFSINVPSTEYVRETDYCGLVSGRTVRACYPCRWPKVLPMLWSVQALRPISHATDQHRAP